ncbi:MAG: hypothetical protein ACJ76X_16900 [Solirubrobacteraceae bacterium]
MRNNAKIRTSIATLAAAFVAAVSVAPAAQAVTSTTGADPTGNAGTLNPGGPVAVRNDGRFGASPEARALDAACSKLMDWANYWAQRAQDAYNNGDQQGYQDALKMYAYNVNQYNKTCAA